MAEFDLVGDRTLEYYHLSFVTGWGMPMSVQPEAISCKADKCSDNLLKTPACPDYRLAINDTATGSTLACTSACYAGIGNVPQNCW